MTDGRETIEVISWSEALARRLEFLILTLRDDKAGEETKIHEMLRVAGLIEDIALMDTRSAKQRKEKLP